jgi:hypothetical protein
VKNSLLMLCGVVAFAIGAAGVANALQAGSGVPPVSIISLVLGVLGFAGNTLRGRGHPTRSDP